MRPSTFVKLPGLFILLAAAPFALVAPAEAAPPEGGGSSGATGIGGFTAPPGAEFDPSTSADPGLLDQKRTRAADQTYGPSGEGGYDIVDTSAYADRGYDSEPHRRELRARKIVPHLARRRSEHGSNMGRYRWVVERTFSWLHNFRRLSVRYDRLAEVHEAFLSLACALICRNALQW